MDQARDLILVNFALKHRFIDRNQLEECAQLFSRDPTRNLTSYLAQKKYLTPKHRFGLFPKVNAFVKGYEDALEAVSALDMDEKILRLYLTLPFQQEVLEALLKIPARGFKPLDRTKPPPPTPAKDPSATRLAPGARKPPQQKMAVVSGPDAPPAGNLYKGRYRLDSEIGRGGLARICLARDTVLERDVALKEMVEGLDNPNLIARFIREGEVAGRLMHPNIVPVYDFGMGNKERGTRPHIVMGLIEGRNLFQILRNVVTKKEPDCKEFTLTRLLGIFQDTCLAIAYAHSQGVIHRDLKPANVMVGSYGEVFVVDWGLARVQESEQETIIMETAGQVEGDSSVFWSPSARLTLKGEVLGTPMYMAPEQAMGVIDEIDELSDVYSLGAILYEILTFQPPYEGGTGYQILEKVREGGVVPPSDRLSQIHLKLKGQSAEREFAFPEDLPPELERIVLRAMARDKKDRFSSVRALHDAVQRFLEIEKDRVKNVRKAEEKIRQGQEFLQEYGAHKARREDLLALVRRAEDRVAPGSTPKEKKELWHLQDEAAEAESAIVRAWSQAARSFQAALEFERDNPQARGHLADMYWDQFIREEEAGSAREMVLYESLVREYNDGQYDDLIEGKGALSVETFAYPCPCLSQGRSVSPAEMEVLGFHPLSGRALDGRAELAGLGAFEPEAEVELRVHGPDCRSETLPGADVWIFRYEEKDRILVPVEPRDVGCSEAGNGAGDAGGEQGRLEEALDALYEPGSPFRPGKGLYLGPTPVSACSLPMGSYMLVLARKGFLPVRVPVRVNRLEEQAARITLFAPGEVPEGYVHVAAGEFLYQGDPGSPGSEPRQVLNLPDVFVSRFPVTCGEYLAFLAEVARRDPSEAKRRTPREAETAARYWPMTRQRQVFLPTAGWLSEAPAATARRARRLFQTAEDWEEDWPVFGISWEDMVAYAGWVGEKSGRLVCIPHEQIWEKAARGADGRPYPWGDRFNDTFCNSSLAHPSGPRPSAVDSFPYDESPHGVRGLGGNARDWCLNEAGSTLSGMRVLRGGFWSNAGVILRSAFRTGSRPTGVYHILGGRLCCLPQSRFVQIRNS
jgi:serine/threonine protein kinase/formylglycine-generating enzyme required for sulfatase activity